MESIIRDQVRQFFYENDQGDSFDIICLDFSKAFDKVPHKRLIKNWRVMGFK